MDWKEIISEIAGLHDFSRHFNNYNYASLHHELVQAGLPISGREWFSFSIASACILSPFSGLVSLVFQDNAYFAAESSIFAFFSSAFLLLKFPSYLKRKRAEEIEREYSIAIREVASGISLEKPFEKIIEGVARGNYGKLSGEFQRALREIESGAGDIGEAMEGISRRTGSQLASRINSQLIFTYESGAGGSGLQKLGEELMLVQKVKMREYSSKMAFLGLVFIAISCIVPALFAAYVIIGSSFLSLSITENDILAAYLLIFPAASLLALIVIKEKSPKILAHS